MVRTLLLSLLFFCAFDPRASAQEAEAVDSDPRVLYDRGELAYTEGRFDEALALFQRAYDISGRAELLYNVGIAATNSGDERTALAALERYLAEIPDAPNRALVEGRLQGLRDEIAEEDELTRLTALERESIARERAAAADGTRTAGIALAITGGALTVAGALLLTFGYLDIASVEGATAGTPWVDLRGANERAPILTGVGYGAAGLGLAVLGIGLGLALTVPSSESVSVTLGPSHLTVTGSF